MKFKNKLPESIESKFSKLAREKNHKRRFILGLVSHILIHLPLFKYGF